MIDELTVPGEPGIPVTEADGTTVLLKQVRDSYDYTHVLRSHPEPKAGGQGMACFTDDAEVIVKLVLADGHVISRAHSPAAFAAHDAAIKEILLKPFPDRVHLARPVARLADYSGYVMRLMRDMTSFSDLAATSVEAIARFPQDGGHRRRFLLLAKLAVQLAKLHGAGLVYCDLSPNNVFVTKDPSAETQNVWLIDADNVFVPGEDAPRLVYTPRYAAPELLTLQPCSQASDCYSLAVLAFESLAALHPFMGNKAEGLDSGDDWDASSTGKGGNSSAASVPDAFPEYSGKLPWVEDGEDDSNHTTNGLPRQFFLTDETFRLFNATFSEEGRTVPQTRPTAALWARAFARSYAQSVRCPACGMSFVHDGASDCCPWCGAPFPPVLTLVSQGQIVFAHEAPFTKDSAGGWVPLPEFLFTPFSLDTAFRTPLAVRTVERAGYGLELAVQPESDSGLSFVITTESGEDAIASRYTLCMQPGATYTLRSVSASGGCTRVFQLELARLSCTEES